MSEQSEQIANVEQKPAWASKLDLVRKMTAKGTSDDEFELFLHICQKCGLDPLARQIYAIVRNDPEADSGKKMSIQTGIDGYRLIADRTERYTPGRAPTFKYDADGRLHSATAYVKKLTREGTWHEVEGVAYFAEYAQFKKGGGLNRMWQDKPHVMLSKCAEANALRKAFPQELSGVYTSDEISETIEAEVVQPDNPAIANTPANGGNGHAKTAPGQSLSGDLTDLQGPAIAEGLCAAGELFRHVKAALQKQTGKPAPENLDTLPQNWGQWCLTKAKELVSQRRAEKITREANAPPATTHAAHAPVPVPHINDEAAQLANAAEQRRAERM